MKPNPSEAGKRIKQLRLSCGFTMEELGRKIDNSPRATISNWERGTNLPNPQKLKLLSTITNSTIDWIKWGTLEEYITSYLIDMSMVILKCRFLIAQECGFLITQNVGSWSIIIWK